MKVYCNNTEIWRKTYPRHEKGMTVPCIILARDNWDDYSHRTSYLASIYGENRKLLHQGTIKILDEHNEKTNLVSYQIPQED